MRIIRSKTLALTLLLIANSVIFAADNPETQNPSLINGLEIEAGYLSNLDAGGEDDSFYKINYRGAQIKERGTPFKYSSHLDLESPKLDSGAGDRSKISFSLENGVGQLGGNLFELDLVQTIKFADISTEMIRGNANVAGNSEAISYSVGLETRPFRLPGLAKTNWSNWAVFGLNAQRTETKVDGSKTDSTGLFTYRLFAGKAFGWRKSANVSETQKKLLNGILQQAPTYEDAKAAYESIKAIDPSSRTVPQQLLFDAYSEHGGESGLAAWRQTLTELTEGHADAITDQPTFAIYLENSGWYDFESESDDDELKNLFTATADYWFLRHRDDVFLRLRYENGYERAAPEIKKDQVSLMLALKF